MKKGTLFKEELAVLKPFDLVDIKGGALHNLPSGLSWKALTVLVIDQFEETKKGFLEGWNFDQ